MGIGRVQIERILVTPTPFSPFLRSAWPSALAEGRQMALCHPPVQTMVEERPSMHAVGPRSPGEADFEPGRFLPPSKGPPSSEEEWSSV